MPYLQAALAMVAVLCLANLALTFALVRRVRRHDEQLAARPWLRGAVMPLPAGTKVPEFAAVTVSGERRTLGDLSGSRCLVGFFTTGCLPCDVQKPEFAEFAKTIPGGAAQVLAVITGAEEEAAEFAADLDGVASVVIEPRHGALAAAFSAHGRPSFYLIDADGRIETSGMTVRMLDRVRV
jgi:peroxiredoxin